jgi:Fic family protein
MTDAAAPSPFYPDAFAAYSSKMDQIDQLRQAIEAGKEADFARWSSILLRLRTDWTYHSCGIEGSALTRAETHFFLAEGLTVEGKSFKDYLDARNHAEAVDFFFDIAANKQTVTEARIKEFNTILLQGNTHLTVKTFEGQTLRRPVHPGVYKFDAEHVKPDMEQMLAWVNEAIHRFHPVHVAAVACYNLVRIRPFDDGNGRCARFLMNLILMNRQYFPAVLHVDRKAQYREALRLAQADPQNPNLEPFVGYIVDTVLSTYQSIVDVLEGRGAQPPGRVRV